MRALEPDVRATIDQGGVRIAYEVYAQERPTTVVLLPEWSIVTSRHWNAQGPALAPHHRVVTFDGRGNGASGRPRGAEAHVPDELVADAVAVLDATETDRAVIAGISLGGGPAVLLFAP